LRLTLAPRLPRQIVLPYTLAAPPYHLSQALIGVCK
jgi:hypothetical protein